jgi:hypothetical protein
MAKFHPRGIAILLFLALLLAGLPSWGETRRSSAGGAVPPAVSLQEEATRIIRLVFEHFSPKTGNTPDPDGSPQQTLPQTPAILSTRTSTPTPGAELSRGSVPSSHSLRPSSRLQYFRF